MKGAAIKGPQGEGGCHRQRRRLRHHRRAGAAGRRARPPPRLNPAMPKEVRYILFSPAEVLDALVAGMVLAQPGWQAAAGRVRLDMATAPSGEVMARLVPQKPRSGPRAHWSFTAGDLLTILLQACRRSRIPLPLRGHKQLELMGTSLCLIIMMGDPQTMPEVRMDEIRYLDPALAPLRARAASG